MQGGWVRSTNRQAVFRVSASRSSHQDYRRFSFVHSAWTMYYSGARPTQNGSYSLFLPSTITDIVEYRHDLDFILVPALERAMRLYIQILSATLPTACVYSVHTRRYVLSFCL